MGGGVDDGEARPVRPGLLDERGQLLGRRLDDLGGFGVAAAVPLEGGGLRVEVDDRGAFLVEFRAHGQVHGDGGLAAPALLADNRNRFHGMAS